MRIFTAIMPVFHVFLTAALLFFHSPSAAQETDFNANEVKALVERWNEAHNTRSVELLSTLYQSTVVFDGQPLKREQCIRLKQKLFAAYSDYRQDMVSGLRYKKIGENVIKCDFNKAVRKDHALWKYPAYLLIVNENNQYTIAGESDNSSNVTLNYYLKHRETLNSNAPVKPEESTKINGEASAPEDTMPLTGTIDSASVFSEDTAVAADRPDPNVSAATKRDSVSSADSDSFFPTDETVTLPLQYVYVFIGILVVGSILILLTSIRSKNNKKKSARSVNRQAEKHDHFDQLQSIQFEKFVMMLFDPLYFRAFRAKREGVLAYAPGGKEVYPELEFEFNHKESRVRFAIESIYISELKHKDIQIASQQQVKAYQQLDEDDNDLYLVVGLEGKPDDPKEIYLIPVKEIIKPFISYPELQRYRKYGMFFYNTENGRLQ